MKSKRRQNIYTLLLALLVVFCSERSFSQDLIFSQYYNAPMYVNPAFAGLKAYPTFSTNYRVQWPTLNNVYETYTFSYDQYFKRQNSGLGFIALTDSQGDGTLKSTKFSGVYSYNVRFQDDWQVRFGLEVGYNQFRIDWNKLIFFDQIDPELGPFDTGGVPFPSTEIQPNNLSNGYLDVGVGMLLYNPNYFVGFSLDHVNGPYAGFLSQGNNNDETAIPLLFSVNAGTQIVLLEDNKGNPTTFISPNVIFAFQSGFSQINAGAYMQVNSLFGGAWIRHTIDNIDAFIFSVGVNLNNLKIGYSFDLTASDLGLNTGGSHELGITLSLKHLEKKESKYNDCFSLFR